MKDFVKSPTGVFVLVVLLIIIGIFLAQLNNYNSITPGVWLQTAGTLIGAFIGALLAGLISLKSVSKQIDYQKREKEINISSKIANSSAQLSFVLSTIISIFKLVREALPKQVNVNDEKNIKTLSINLNLYQLELLKLEALKESINRIDISDFPFNEHYWAEHIKLVMAYRITELSNLIARIIEMRRLVNNGDQYYKQETLKLAKAFRSEIYGDENSFSHHSVMYSELKRKHLRNS